MKKDVHLHTVNPVAIRKVKIVYNFGLSECNWIKMPQYVYLNLGEIKQ